MAYVVVVHSFDAWHKRKIHWNLQNLNSSLFSAIAVLFYCTRLNQVVWTEQVLEGSDSSDGSTSGSSSSSVESPNIVFVSLIENLLTVGPERRNDGSHVPAGEVVFTKDYNEWHHHYHVMDASRVTVPNDSLEVNRSQTNIRESNQCLEISHRAVLRGRYFFSTEAKFLYSYSYWW